MRSVRTLAAISAFLLFVAVTAKSAPVVPATAGNQSGTSAKSAPVVPATAGNQSDTSVIKPLSDLALFYAEHQPRNNGKDIIRQAGDSKKSAETWFGMANSKDWQDLIGKFSTVMTVASGVDTLMKTYDATHDPKRSIATGVVGIVMDGIVGIPSAFASIGCSVADTLQLTSQKNLCTFMQTTAFSPDYYTKGLLDWLGEGVTIWSAPDPVGSVVSAGEWLRRGTKGALETGWNLAVGSLKAMIDSPDGGTQRK